MPPSVVFLPGAGGDGDFWSPVVARLPADWGTRQLSWPGAGMIAPVAAVNGYLDLIELTAHQVPDGSDVVAQSMGGVVAIGLALSRPGKLRRLVLVATSGGLDVAGLGADDWRDEYRAEFPGAASWVTDDRVDFTARLAEIELSICLIWGDADPISPVAVGRALEGILPSSSLHVLAGGGHDLARQHVGAVAALIERHLSGSAAA